MAVPDGTRQEFTDVDEAQSFRAATPGSQLRTVPRERDVPAEYVVVLDDEVVSRHQQPRDASVASRALPGSYVMLSPIE